MSRRLLAGVGGCSCLLWLGSPSTARADEPGSALTATALVAEIEAVSAALSRAEIDGVDWQRRVEALFARVEVGDLRAALTLDWRSIAATTRADGRAELRLEPGELRGTPSEPHFRRKLFSLSRGRAILPHGHRNIVSAFVVLDGRFRGRHFDRVRDEPEAIVIRPTDDRSFAPGDCAAISDHVDNVHWFTALEDQAVLFNVSVTVPERLRVRAGSTGRVYLDPEGEALDGGLIRAPRAGVAALRAKYETE